MQIKTTDIHNRTLNVSEIPAQHPDDVRDMNIAIAYTEDGKPAIHKAVALDKLVVPFILKAVETYNRLLALKQAGKLETVLDLASQNMLELDDEDMEDEAETQHLAVEALTLLVESLDGDPQQDLALRDAAPKMLDALKETQKALACWRDNETYIHPAQGAICLEEVKYCVVDIAIATAEGRVEGSRNDE